MTPIAKYTIVGIAAFLAGYAIRPTPPEVKSPTQENLPKESSTAIIADPMIDNLDTASFVKEAASSHIAPNLKRNEEAFALREFLLGDFKSDGGWISLDLLTADWKITDSFAKLYGLSESELSSLNTEAIEAGGQYFQMVLAHSEISISDDGSTSITVLPFEGAEDTYSSLLDSFKKTLGDQKFTDFLELGEPALRKNFNQFGGAKLVATISRDDKNSTEDKTLYKVVEKVESMGNTSSTTSNNISEEKLAKDYGLIKQLADWKSQQP